MIRLAAVGVLAGLAAGCAALKYIRGPVWSERLAPIETPDEVADHRQRERLVFAVVGDAGTGKADQRRVAAHLADVCREGGGCDFVLVAGDNVYRVGVSPPRDGPHGVRYDRRFFTRFEEPYAPLGGTDFWLVAGNHDWLTRDSVETEIRYTAHSDRWRMLAHDYAVPRLPDWLHVYGLATTKLRRGVDLAQLDRARAALGGREGWRLLLGHHPVYSSGLHANARGFDPPLRDVLLPWIESCGVHFYFAGHDHHQEHLTARSFEQIVQGAGGKLRRVRRIAERADGVRQLAAAERLGFALVEATPDELTLRFYGHAAGTPFGSFHCRSFRRSEFRGPAARSQPCARESEP